MENGTFAPPFFIIFKKNLTFQRHPKALVWSKGLISKDHTGSILNHLPASKNCWKRSGSVVECLTQDLGAAGLSILEQKHLS